MTENRDFLMLAHTFDPKKHGIGGWFVSEKLDGQRAFWDGGISRGMPKHEVPWANLARDHKEFTSTGLWSRLGNVIHAPDWWLDALPPVMLDGELWVENFAQGGRQDLSRIVKRHSPGLGWQKVRFHVFGMPSLAVFRDGKVKFGASDPRKVFKGIKPDLSKLDYIPSGMSRFVHTVERIKKFCDGNIAVAHPQERLPFQTSKALEVIEYKLETYTSQGGEGLIVRKPESYWTPKRVKDLLKVKQIDDAEGIVTGFITGRETDKGSKLLGLMGALILDYEGKRLELSGFTDEERTLVSKKLDGDAQRWAELSPGEEVPDWIEGLYFKRGDHVTFKYRGKSKDGIPTEARYWRKRV